MLLDSGIERRAPPPPAGVVSRVMTAVGQSVLPVIALVGALVLAWSLRAEPATDFRFLTEFDPSLDPADGNWLTWGVLLLPGVFFVLNLTSRRYGPSLAAGSVIVGWASIAGGIYWALSQGVIHSFADEVAPVPVAAAFFGSMLIGQFVNICFFDWMRGVPWWHAPLLAALMGGLVFAATFHTASGGTWNAAALPRLSVLGAIQLLWALVQLIPTQLLRRAIRPHPGYGGA